jgi:hypothetical protein
MPAARTFARRLGMGLYYRCASRIKGSGQEIPMATPGLALVGFMGRDEALHFLTTRCIPPSPDPAELERFWTNAAAGIGTAIPNAGHPDVLVLPASISAHVDDVRNAPGFAEAFAARNPSFMLVEIGPLLAFQYLVDLDRSTGLCGQVKPAPTVEETIGLCLPPVPGPIQFGYAPSSQGNGILFKSCDLNLRLAQGRLVGPDAAGRYIAGMEFGSGPAVIQVARLRGRYYLRNGYHRLCGLRQRKLTHAPCMVFDARDETDLGLAPGGTFGIGLLESANPPTVDHFAQGRASSVMLRRMARHLTVTWTEYVLPDE